MRSPPELLHQSRPEVFPFGSRIPCQTEPSKWHITDPDLQQLLLKRGEYPFSLSIPSLVFALYELTTRICPERATIWEWFESVASICQSEFENLEVPDTDPEGEEAKQYIEYHMGAMIGGQKMLYLDKCSHYGRQGTPRLVVVRGFKWVDLSWGKISLGIVHDRDEEVPYSICLKCVDLMPRRLHELGIAVTPPIPR